MGWSNDQFTGTLVIPTGATTGARIEIDGLTGRIEVYDAANNLAYVIDGAIPGATAGAAGSPQVTISTTGTTGQITVPTNGPAENTVAQIVSALFNSGMANENVSLQIVGPSVDAPANDRLELLLSSQNADGSSEANLIVRVAGGTTGNLITLDEVVGLTVLRNLRITSANFLIDAVDQGRGLRDYTAIIASTGTVTTTETIGITSASTTFKAGRAYRITAKGWVQSTVLGDLVRIRVKKTNAAGQGFIDSFDGLRINSAAGMTAFHLQNVAINGTGADVTAALVMTYVRDTGTGNVLLGASAPNPAYIEIVDIGAAADYPDANEIA